MNDQFIVEGYPFEFLKQIVLQDALHVSIQKSMFTVQIGEPIQQNVLDACVC